MIKLCATFLFLAAIFGSDFTQANAAECKGPSNLPAAGMTSPWCHNGRMGFAATEFAPLSKAANMPELRAADFARREAELKARGALAKFLNETTMWESSIQSSNMIDSSEKQAWLAFVSHTQAETLHAKLAAGVRVVAADVHDGAMYVTVATSPDMQDMADSISNYRPNAPDGTAPPSVNGRTGADPYGHVPKNVAPDLR